MKLPVLLLTAGAILGLPNHGVTQTVRLGVMAGWSQTGFERGDVSGWEYRTGYAIRVAAIIGPVGRILFQPEVSWTEKGAERAANALGRGSPGSAFRFRYLAFGLMGHYAPAVLQWGAVRASAFAGPTLGLLMDCQTRGPHAEHWGNAANAQQEIDCDEIDTGLLHVGVPGDNVRRSDPALAVGTQVRWDFGGTEALTEFRYEYGLSDLDPNLTQANRSFEITVGVWF